LAWRLEPSGKTAQSSLFNGRGSSCFGKYVDSFPQAPLAETISTSLYREVLKRLISEILAIGTILCAFQGYCWLYKIDGIVQNWVSDNKFIATIFIIVYMVFRWAAWVRSREKRRQALYRARWQHPDELRGRADRDEP
jgi:hypothetical protein